MSKIDHNRPKRVRRPLISSKDKEEIKRGVRVLKRRLAKGHRNPQAHLHGDVRVYSAEEREEVARANPDLLKYPKK